jgi:parallel beta-helix repeat protein
MRIPILVSLILSCALTTSRAATYYFNSNGSDDRSIEQIQSSQTPGRSLAYASSITLAPGDSLLFKAGDTLRGELALEGLNGTAGEPIVVGTYGSGPAPVLAGTRTLSDWTKEYGSLYSVPVDTMVYQLFVDGEPLILARYPNNGYLSVESVQNTRTQFSDNDLPASIDWTGASVHVRSKPWSLDARTVTAFTTGSGAVTMDRDANYDLHPSQAYFFNNHKAALDTAGEWFYEASVQKLYLWMPNGASPDDHRVEVSVHKCGIDADNCSHLRIESLVLFGHFGSGVKLSGSVSDTRISGVSALYPAGIGMKTSGGARNQLVDNTIVGANIYGIQNQTSDALIEANVIRKIGLKDRLLANGLGGRCCRARGLQTSGEGSMIRGNVLDSIGYNGIGFGNQNNLIERNVIRYFCLTTYDGSAIYTWSSDYEKPGAMGTVIRENLVIGGAGPAGDQVAPGWWQNGIYLDDRTHGITVEGNTVIRTYHGIYLHNTKRHIVRNNTIFQAYDDAFKMLEDKKGFGEPMEDNVIVGNTIVSPHAARALIAHRGLLPPHGFGRIDSNLYFNPYNPLSFLVSNNPDYPASGKVSKALAFPQWQKEFGLDSHSRWIDTVWQPQLAADTLSDNLLGIETFESGAGDWNCWPKTTCSIAHDPESSMLVYTNGSGGENYSLANGVSFAVKKGEHLLLTFTARSPDSATVRIEPRFSHAPWSTFAPYKQFALTGEPATYTYLFTSTRSDEQVRIDFRLEPNDTMELQSVSLYTVTPKEDNWQDKLTIVYNAQPSTKSIPLPEGSWRELGTDTPAGGAMTLRPFASAVLIADENVVSAGANFPTRPIGDRGKLRVKFVGRELLLDGCPAGVQTMVLSTLAGRVVRRQHVEAARARVNLSSIARGMYVVSLQGRHGATLSQRSLAVY